MTPRRQQLLATAERFCGAFVQRESIDTILSFFSSTQEVRIIEHGEPLLAPFLGKWFNGLSGVQAYFEMIGSLLSWDDIRFSEFVIDEELGKVAVKGGGQFTWKSTGDSWKESFAYVLDFDEEGMITQYQVWADSGAAYLARIGKLKGFKGD
ncbi:hypothetical protein AMATHDRAFT_139771 [Amanita thiersii Skay4041]|uniref:SnoaL-like domain-containing protein n=1 Tax=Amanita thiersii Skay4041 TaxID=703135 RepID=A0A2A9NTC2_9AGAR|nr:hypothetical protein AMATHDRAFT_139771 [Amanita thiersii Skay4041]